MPTVAINGLGRIGRAAPEDPAGLRGARGRLVNDIAAADNLAYLLNYDTVYGRYTARSAPMMGRWSWTTAGSRSSPSVTRAPCRGATWGSTWCWSTPCIQH